MKSQMKSQIKLSKKLLKLKKSTENNFKDLKQCKKTHCYGIFPDKEKKEIHKKCDDEANKKFEKTKKNDKKIFSKKFDTIFKCLKKNKYNKKSQKEGECIQSKCKKESNKFLKTVILIKKKITKEPQIIKYKKDYQKNIKLENECNQKNCSSPDITDDNKFKCNESKCSKERKLSFKKLMNYSKEKDKYLKQFFKKNNS
jgi:hypothetical protein